MVAKILGYLNAGSSKKARSLNETLEYVQGKEEIKSLNEEQ